MSSFLFKNAQVVLDGHSQRQPSFNILVKDNCIAAVTRDPIDPRDAMVIDVGGRTLMPGLIDAHAHITGLSLSPKNLAYPAADLVLAAATYLRNSLMAGFTTIREAGGADYTIAHLLKSGTIIGPRMFYSGKALTQTGGGADFRTPIELTDPCGHVSPFSVSRSSSTGSTRFVKRRVRNCAKERLS
jgi:imidazolonepropionase-like amidohydrolase